MQRNILKLLPSNCIQAIVLSEMRTHHIHRSSRICSLLAGVTVVLKFLKFQNCPEIVLKLHIVLKF